MIEIYSKNVEVAANAAIPLNVTAVNKGTSIVNNGAATLQFNKCGLYKVSVSASGIAGEAGDITIQLYKNGVAQAPAVATETAADTTSTHNLSFTTIVQVGANNTNCPCSSPTLVTVINSGVAATFSTVDVVATKLM